jgi:hypothetical protein
MPLDPTHVRLKLLHACDQWHSSRQSTALTVVTIIYEQTLKAMIAEVDDDGDQMLSFREFLMIYKKAAAGTLQCAGLVKLAGSVNVTEVGAKGAKAFFDAHATANSQANKMEMEIKAEQAAKKEELEAAKTRKAAFKAKMASFKA